MSNLPSKNKIEDLTKRCEEAETKGITRFQGMSYEQGVLYGIRWMLGLDEYDPLSGPKKETPVPRAPFDDEIESKVIVVAVSNRQTNTAMHS